MQGVSWDRRRLGIATSCIPVDHDMSVEKWEKHTVVSKVGFSESYVENPNDVQGVLCRRVAVGAFLPRPSTQLKRLQGHLRGHKVKPIKTKKFLRCSVSASALVCSVCTPRSGGDDVMREVRIVTTRGRAQVVQDVPASRFSVLGKRLFSKSVSD